MSRFRHILTKSANGVETITLNRPDKRNALCPLLIEELTQALKECEKSDCGVVILTGAGPAFCAGLDMEHLATMKAETLEDSRRDAENMARVLRTLYDFPKPVIAAVNGHAIAGGMALATIPDFTLAVPEAKFGYTEVKVGFVPAIAASFLLRQVGELRTRELLLSGKLIKAHEALEMGLVTQIVNADELMGTAQRPCPESAVEQPAGHAGSEAAALQARQPPPGRGTGRSYPGERATAVGRGFQGRRRSVPRTPQARMAESACEGVGIFPYPYNGVTLIGNINSAFNHECAICAAVVFVDPAFQYPAVR